MPKNKNPRKKKMYFLNFVQTFFCWTFFRKKIILKFAIFQSLIDKDAIKKVEDDWEKEMQLLGGANMDFNENECGLKIKCDTTREYSYRVISGAANVIGPRICWAGSDVLRSKVRDYFFWAENPRNLIFSKKINLFYEKLFEFWDFRISSRVSLWNFLIYFWKNPEKSVCFEQKSPIFIFVTGAWQDFWANFANLLKPVNSGLDELGVEKLLDYFFLEKSSIFEIFVKILYITIVPYLSKNSSIF